MLGVNGSRESAGRTQTGAENRRGQIYSVSSQAFIMRLTPPSALKTSDLSSRRPSTIRSEQL